MKKMALIAAFVIALLPVVAFADFEIILKNTTDEKLVYSLTWLDHPFEMPDPMMMAGGELESGKEDRLEYKYKPGIYRVSWFNRDNNMTFNFRVQNNDVKTVIIMPNSVGFNTK